MHKRHITGLIICLLVTASVPAQQYFFTTYSVNDGLVHNAVRKIYQDKKGFLWIGTWEGLSKYDGHRFLNYTTADGMSNDFINDLLEMPDGDMTVACNDGSFYRIAPAIKPQQIFAGSIVVNKLFAVEKDKWLALTDNHGIQQWQSGQLQQGQGKVSQDSYFNMNAFNDSLLLAMTDATLRLFDHRLQIFAQSADAKINYYGCGLLKDSQGRCWVGTNNGLKLLNPVQKKEAAVSFIEPPAVFQHPLLKTLQIRAIVEDAHNNLWFGTNGGLVRVSANGLINIITRDNGLPVPDISCLYFDREQNLWIGGSRGLAKLVTRTALRQFEIDKERTSNQVYHLAPFNDGNVMALTDEGALLFSKTADHFLPVPLQNPITVSPQLSWVTTTIKGNKYHFAVFACRPGKQVSFSAAFAPGAYSFRDAAGNFFALHPNGVGFSRDLVNWSEVLYSGDVRAVMHDTRGRLWVGTYNDGLLCISYRYQAGTPILISQKQFLPGIGIRSLFEDSKGAVWAGSRYRGVFKIDANRGIRQFSQTNGLTSNRIMGIAEDRKGAIWLNFFNGLDKLIPEGSGYRVFNFSRVHNFFSDIHTIVPIETNMLWLATPQGIVQLSDGEVETLPPVGTSITSATFGDSTYNPATVQSLNLAYGLNQVQFTFAAPGFINDKQTLYSYRLLGSSNEEWSTPSNEYRVSFASLQAADYRFEVRGLGYNNQWGQAGIISFNIQPPFWLSWWFITGLGLLTATAVYFFVRRHINNVRTKAEMKQRIAEAEVSALRAQMNPHFIFNCLSAIDNMIETDQKEKATTYLNRFARLIRGVLDSSKKTIVPLHSDIETLNLYLELEKFRCDERFSYTITTDPELLNSDYKVPPLVVQPYVENAIHHGLLNRETAGGHLELSLTMENNCLVYRIKDNGVGRLLAGELKHPVQKKHTSYGMAITEERIRMFNEGQIKKPVVITDLICNGMPAGTLIEVFLKTD